jgi:hypothetical protein
MPETEEVTPLNGAEIPSVKNPLGAADEALVALPGVAIKGLSNLAHGQGDEETEQSQGKTHQPPRHRICSYGKNGRTDGNLGVVEGNRGTDGETTQPEEFKESSDLQSDQRGPEQPADQGSGDQRATNHPLQAGGAIKSGDDGNRRP